MTYPAALLVHQASIQTGVTPGVENAYGSTEIPVSSTIPCRFGVPKTDYRSSDSGDRVIKTPVCIVPADTVTKEGYEITGLTAPFTKKYRIKQINPAMLASSVSHLVLQLEAVS